MTPSEDLNRRTALFWVAVATALGAAFRFYYLAWGAPYFHFHIDEHFVFGPADLLRRSTRAAAMSPKFFMYSPLPMYLVNLVRAVYEDVMRPLVLTVPRDEITYMVLGRAISATLGTATIPLVYHVASRVAGRLAGVLAAVLLACSVIHLRESHFFTVDISMTFFTVLAWCFLVRTVERGDTSADVGAGVGLGVGLLSKYTAAFLVPLIGLAQLLSPKAPRQLRPLGAWVRPVVRGAFVVAIGVAVFLVLDPLVLQYYGKFRSDIQEQITNPLLGVSRPIWLAHFTDVNPLTYWFTNLLWWGLGPAFEIWALAGVIWLFLRRDRLAFLAAAFPIVFWLLAGRSLAPFIRYAVPLAPPLAVAGGVLSADCIRRRRWRGAAMVATLVVVTTTALWAIAYVNVFGSPDSRLEASAWLLKNVPRDAKILVEPSHNIPPMGSYLTNVDFNGDYVLWRSGQRHDYYHLSSLDTYQYLYDHRTGDDDRRRYIQTHLSGADWIVMDDTFLQFYQHLPERDHGVVKQYYRDLFAGRLGFQLVQTFKVYPSLFGRTINDDEAELTFRLFDHPRVFIFKRQ